MRDGFQQVRIGILRCDGLLRFVVCGMNETAKFLKQIRQGMCNEKDAFIQQFSSVEQGIGDVLQVQLVDAEQQEFLFVDVIDKALCKLFELCKLS